MSARALSAVIAFPEHLVRQAAGPRPEGPGEILIFPGVQVERLLYDLADCLPPTRAAAATRSSEFDFY